MADEITLRQNYWRQLRDYFDSVRIEMKRVTWPGKQEVYGTTVMVILTTFFFAFYFWISDQIFSNLILRIMRSFQRGG